MNHTKFKKITFKSLSFKLAIISILFTLLTFTLFLVVSCGVKTQNESSFESGTSKTKNSVTTTIRNKLIPFNSHLRSFNNITEVVSRQLPPPSSNRSFYKLKTLSNFYRKSFLKFEFGVFNLTTPNENNSSLLNFNFSYLLSKDEIDFPWAIASYPYNYYIKVDGKYNNNNHNIENADIFVQVNDKLFKIYNISRGQIKFYWTEYLKLLLSNSLDIKWPISVKDSQWSQLSDYIEVTSMENKLQIKKTTSAPIVIDTSESFLINIRELDIKFNNSDKKNTPIFKIDIDFTHKDNGKNFLIINQKGVYLIEASSEPNLENSLETPTSNHNLKPPSKTLLFSFI